LFAFARFRVLQRRGRHGPAHAAPSLPSPGAPSSLVEQRRCSTCPPARPQCRRPASRQFARSRPWPSRPYRRRPLVASPCVPSSRAPHRRASRARPGGPWWRVGEPGPSPGVGAAVGRDPMDDPLFSLLLHVVLCFFLLLLSQG
jgi:hypothetical protein